VKTQIAMPFGRSSTITLIKRIEYRAICAVEVCAFGKIFEFSHRLDPKRSYHPSLRLDLARPLRVAAVGVGLLACELAALTLLVI
jgi:hypothetical protein